MYSYIHIDSTIAVLREGLCLLNPERVNENNMPEFLKSWDKIWCPPMVDIGYHQTIRASLWIGVNLLSVDRASNYDDWIKTGFCIHSLSRTKFGYDLWIKFSRKSIKFD